MPMNNRPQPAGPRILIVDDEFAVLDTLAGMVSMQLKDAIVDTANTGEAALREIRATDYEAIITDIRMADMDGLALLKEIRAIRPSTPTILITGLDDHEMSIKALRMGAYDYIRKPIAMDYFLASVNRAITMRQLSREIDEHKLALEQHASDLERIVQDRTRELSREIAERKQVEEALQESNAKLTAWVTQLEHRTQQITFLSEMTALLQACQSVEEACTIATHFLKELFAGDSGTLCLYNPTIQLVEAMTSWGPHTATINEFSPEMCWALRRLQPHLMGDLSSTLICEHVRLSQAPNYICMPMIGQGKTLGLLVLQSGTRDLSPEAEIRKNAMLAKQRLGEAVGNHIALALANLQLRETLRNESIRDPLTDLFNRRYLEETLPREIRRAVRDERPISVIMIDVDHFKEFNDKFSHEAGDAMLRAVAQHLKARTRGQDIACRYGGDEFLLVLPGASLEVACQRAERLRAEIKEMEVERDSLSFTSVCLSLGVAAFPDHGSTAAALVRAADLALYRAKAQGRNQVVQQATLT
jgi:diguanylate cyclase (GGDEF)-like protein